MVCDEKRLKYLTTSQNLTKTSDLYQSVILKVTQKKTNQETYFIAFLSFLIVFILFTNSLMIIGIWKTNKKLTKYHKLLIYTSAVDLLIGVFAVPYFIGARLINKSSCFHTMIAITIGAVVSEDGKQTILTLSIMRYRSLHSPFTQIHNSCILRVVIIQILISIGVSFLNFQLNYANVDNINMYTVQWLTFSLLTIAWIVAAVICNLLSRRTLLNKKNIQQSDQHLERHQKAVKRMLLMCLCNIICYMPTSFYQLYAGIFTLIYPNIDLSDIILITLNLDLLYVVMLLSPALNSLVYVIWNKRILNYYQRVLAEIKNG
jgi:hypothetical protein